VHAALRRPGRVFCYAYLAELDTIGHVYGPGSPAWLAQLRLTDRLVELVADDLPPACGLTVVADHGMVALDDAEVIEFDDEPDLADGVAEVAGEIRCRYLYLADGALPQVKSTWQARPGYRVMERDEAIGAGLFGGAVRDEVRGRIGDLLVIPTGRGGVRCRSRERRESRLPGQNGALTEAELLVPRLTRLP
jgi:predicted AlkP superfamily pyrophosphatase or phosphodiesterase